jgi:hypothetical protein
MGAILVATLLAAMTVVIVVMVAGTAAEVETE